MEARRAKTRRSRDLVHESRPPEGAWIGCLLALAYPDRIGQQRHPGGAQYRLSNGRAAMFADADALMKHGWLVVADLGSRQGQREERIYLAADLDPSLFENVLSDQVSQVDELDWDEREGVLRAERQQRIGELVLSTIPLTDLSDEARSFALVNYVRRKGLELLAWTPELRQWQARVGLLRNLDLGAEGVSDWPDVSDAALLLGLEDWLLPYLAGVTRLSHFARVDLCAALNALLPWPLNSWTLWRLRRFRCPLAPISGSTTTSIRLSSRYGCRSFLDCPRRLGLQMDAKCSSCICSRPPGARYRLLRIWRASGARPMPK